MSECSIVLSSQNKGGRCAPGPQSACTAFAPFPPLLSAASARAHANSQPHSSPVAPGVLPGAFFRCLQTMLVWTVATHTTQAHWPGRPLGSLRGGLRPRGLANGPGGAYLSTVRQGWKCSIPCKFPDSLLRVKHAEQNVMRRALPLTHRKGCTPLPPRAALALSVYYALRVKRVDPV